MKTFVLLLSVLLTGCSYNNIQSYQDDPIQFDPEVFFNGPLVAEGIVRNRSGKVIRYFEADIDASWNQNGGTLDERFRWNDGEMQTRYWKFTRSGDQQFTGSAGDVVGDAQLKYAGNAIRMDYVLQVPLKNQSSININIKDWLFQVNEQSIMNVTTMKKFGFRVGDVILTIRRIQN